MADIPRLLQAEDVAQILGVPRKRVYDLARAGALPAVHLGKQVRFPEEKLLAWIEAGGTHRNGDKT